MLVHVEWNILTKNYLRCTLTRHIQGNYMSLKIILDGNLSISVNNIRLGQSEGVLFM